MSISIQDVEHMAKLARLNVTDTEKEKYAKEFSDILAYIEKLNEVDTGDTQPMIGASSLTNVFREDEVTRESGTDVRKEFLSHAPEHSDEYVETISPFQEI